MMFVVPGQGAAIDGRAVPVAEAVAAAAALLGRAAAPLIAGLRTDDAGARAAAALARRLDAVLDHAESAAALRDLAAMRDTGWIVATPLLVRAQADLVFLVGDGHAEAWPDFATRLGLDRPPTLAAEPAPRRVEHLPPGADLTARLGLLRALVKGHTRAAPPDLTAPDLTAPDLTAPDLTAPDLTAPDLTALAATLRGARYGVAVWSAARLDALGVEMLCGLIDDLNAATRFAGLPLPAGGNAAGVAQALAAATGFPFRIAFRNGVPHHDAWRYDAARLVAGGETDAVLWLDALGGGPPPWPALAGPALPGTALPGTAPVKLVALAPAGARFATAPAVALAVGRPGIDHAAALHDPAAAALCAAVPAAPAAGATPTAADLLGRITAALPPC